MPAHARTGHVAYFGKRGSLNERRAEPHATTKKPYTVNGVAHVFKRAFARAAITTGDVTLHTLRHTALSRMIAAGQDDYTVMEISGHSATRMLARYTHPTEERKVGALELPSVGRIWQNRKTPTTKARRWRQKSRKC